MQMVWSPSLGKFVSCYRSNASLGFRFFWWTPACKRGIWINNYSGMIYLLTITFREKYSQILNLYKQGLRLWCFLSSWIFRFVYDCLIHRWHKSFLTLALSPLVLLIISQFGTIYDVSFSVFAAQDFVYYLIQCAWSCSHLPSPAPANYPSHPPFSSFPSPLPSSLISTLPLPSFSSPSLSPPGSLASCDQIWGGEGTGDAGWAEERRVKKGREEEGGRGGGKMMEEGGSGWEVVVEKERWWFF